MKQGEEEVEEYLQTANWQLGNRRVRCRLMLDTGREEGEERGRHTFTKNGRFVSVGRAAACGSDAGVTLNFDCDAHPQSRFSHFFFFFKPL